MLFLWKRTGEASASLLGMLQGSGLLELLNRTVKWTQYYYRQLQIGNLRCARAEAGFFKPTWQINFCCLLARYYIWICKKKETAPRIEGFLKYLKSVYDIEVKTGAEVPKKWEILKSFSRKYSPLSPCKKYTSLPCQCVTSLAISAT